MTSEHMGTVEAFQDDDLERAIDAVAQRLGVDLSGRDLVLRGSRRAG
jgi:Fe2+ or Zn2+ uptake regulation protein